MQRPHVSSARRRLLYFAVGVGGIACGASRIEHTPRVAHDPIEDAGVTSRGQGDGAIAADASVAAEDSHVAPRARCGNLRWVPQFCYVRDLGDPEAKAGTDEEAWLTAHGAKAADVKAQMKAHLLGAMCRPLSAGPAKEDALFCMYHTQSLSRPGSSVYRGVQRARIVTVRGGVLAVLLDVPFSFANFDSPGQPAEGDETEIFGLQIDTRDAATKIVLSEPRLGECAVATSNAWTEIRARLQQKPVAVEVETMRFDVKLLGTICGAAKTYAWTKGRYGP